MIPWLDQQTLVFPPINTALADPNGLLAVGGDLSPDRLIAAYRQGIFPWFSDEEPILWWSPSPRCVLKPADLHISKSLAKFIKKTSMTLSIDQQFDQVINACAQLRKDQEGSWITEHMQQAYQHLFDRGVAHSVEVWQGQHLVGGLYGLAIGNVFFGESMFSRESNASKLAFYHLVQHLSKLGFTLIDCQVHSEHLQSLGASEISRDEFQAYLSNIDTDLADKPSLWHKYTAP
ncbi:MAG: leucyl/phenylalanyl-tRNA--protein transferase [Oceanospirillaceae bacterium]|nr:leucyl/phenylalanyl-tRNA--protein transferase [Oceanospirillaceae bacterium]NRB42861.1 leucyl/phenylalanyl-tRNA--protein transferase [Pseudomonadales bacterium]